MNFGGIDEYYSSFDNARFVVIPVPYDLTSTYQSGSRKGPSAIIEASCNMELYDEELCRETYLCGIHTTDPLEIDASGPERMVDRIATVVGGVCDAGKIPVMLGGEHSVTIGAVSAMKDRYPGISILHLDAHADMRAQYQGTPFSHAAVARRAVEMAPVVQVGIRSMSAEEAEFISEQDIFVMTPDDIKGDCDWVKKVCERLSEDVYVTIDLDVLDPSILPATGTPEPGGLQWDDLRALLSQVAQNSRVRGFDVVELCPIPGLIASDFIAAKLTYRVMGYITASE